MANEGEKAGAGCWLRCASYGYERKYAIKVLIKGANADNRRQWASARSAGYLAH
jgi:hypothetical protein